ncbi:uncharacterized protein FSUBG_2535 [Fusarium subglutinans]|uniref:Uncharacterized protein n=1 Tax=Gibberella subglutinans TaxID=42677 RepID=A0A8H5Q898_GIBSU|nr:uncharacterized protein FSUBG_2535 [Fusarium subglutinans]KAF5610991.1 hypothetical protein FSUBG_2535 [Fusarium subglutinans]
MDLRHSPPRKRLKSFHAVSQDIAQFAHPGHAETVPMDIDRPGDAAQDSPTFLYSSGVNTANADILHHQDSRISPEERRVETYTRSIMPAPNTKDTTTKGLIPYRMPKLCDDDLDRYIKGLEKGTNQPPFARTASKTLFVFYCNVSVDELALYCATFFSLNKSQMPRIHARAVMLLVEESDISSSSLNTWEMIDYAHDKMELEIHMHLPWRDFIGLAEATAPLRDAGFQLSVTFNEEEWSDIPSQYRDFHKALATKAITGVELDAANLRFQQDMPEFIADQLTAYGTRGFRPNKRRWHSSLANIS